MELERARSLLNAERTQAQQLHRPGGRRRSSGRAMSNW